MNVVNRLVLVTILLALIIVIIVVAVVPQQSFRLTSSFFGWLDESAELYASSSDWPLYAGGRVLIGGGLIIVLIFFLFLELRNPKKKTVRVQKLAGGEAHITVDSISQRLAYNIDQLPDVVKVTPKIHSRARGVDIDLLLETAPDIDVPMKTEEVLEVTREVVAERMGLKIGKVQVKIKHAPFPKE